jgi:flavin-dependent thymidylate synthase
MKNTVELIGHYGSDESHALSAWSSTSRELNPFKRDRIPALLNQLRQGSDGHPHGTPFEKSALHFLVRSDIASHIHLLKHRIGVSINAESARYKELKRDTPFIPEDWPEPLQKELERHCQESFRLYHRAIEELVEQGFSRKRAKESARFFNPYATQLTADIQFNFRSFVWFCELRCAPGAQKEIRDIAKDMIRQVMAIEGDPFHHSIRAWDLHKMVE